jgi:hypothetical protein
VLEEGPTCVCIPLSLEIIVQLTLSPVPSFSPRLRLRLWQGPQGLRKEQARVLSEVVSVSCEKKMSHAPYELEY